MVDGDPGDLGVRVTQEQAKDTDQGLAIIQQPKMEVPPVQDHHQYIKIAPLMVTGALGVLGEVAPNHVDLEQKQGLGAATILLQGMGGDIALDQAAPQDLATQDLVHQLS